MLPPRQARADTSDQRGRVEDHVEWASIFGNPVLGDRSPTGSSKLRLTIPASADDPFPMFQWWHHLRWQLQARDVLSRAETLSRSTSGPSLAEQVTQLRWLAKSGHSLKSLLPQTFALGVEASRRVLGKTHYPVQIVGGIALIDGFITEMQTGEGKTLTAVLPALLQALPGRGCHVLTANEYLAKRDAEEMGRVFKELGLTTGCLEDEMDDSARVTAVSVRHHLRHSHSNRVRLFAGSTQAGSRTE